MVAVFLILALIFVFLKRMIYSDKINVSELPQTIGTVKNVVVNDGVTQYYIQFQYEGKVYEARTRRHRVVGRKFSVGEVVNIRYNESSAGVVTVIIDEAGYELYDERYDKEAQIISLMAKLCVGLTILTLLCNVVTLII